MGARVEVPHRHSWLGLGFGLGLGSTPAQLVVGGVELNEGTEMAERRRELSESIMAQPKVA